MVRRVSEAQAVRVDLVRVVVVWLMNLVRVWPCKEVVQTKGRAGLGRSASMTETRGQRVVEGVTHVKWTVCDKESSWM